MLHCKKSTAVYFFLALILSGIFTVCFYASRLQNRFDSTLYPNVIRLHVVAESNRAEDLALKNALRQRVTDYVTALTRYSKTKADAEQIVRLHLDDIRSFSEAQVKKLGGSARVGVSFRKENYTVRSFGGMTFPAGQYQSLRITLGDAKGKNWWCVLYPNLCGIDESDEAKALLQSGGVSQKAADAVCDGEDYTVCFYFLELMKNLSPRN